MKKEKKDALNKERLLRKTVATMKMGVYNITHERIRLAIALVSMLLVVVGYFFRGAIIRYINFNTFFDISIHEFPTYYKITAFIFVMIVIYGCGFPVVNYRNIENPFRRIGFVNRAEDPPFLKGFRYYADDGPGSIFIFDSCGIPLSDWEDHKEEIETALNMRVVSFKRGNTLGTVIAHMVSPEYEPDGIIPWDDSYMSEKEFELALGASLIGTEYANLDIVSHALVAGSTGSGKTIMLKNIIYQCIKKGAKVALVDFKGGANFSRKWRSRTDFISNAEELDKMLTWALSELNNRKKMFSQYECEDIISYNKKTSENMNRIIIVFDEVAQCLDKTGLSSEAKKMVQEYEYKLATIARLGRAFGIHLILGLQRPDATVITGQIKSNIDLRMCGRSDDVLSQIVLDNTDASREIGKEDRGKFMLSNGHLIQGYYFADENFVL